jgi:hypothetical protein
MTTTKPDLFADFKTASEILAFMLHLEGPEALQQLLNHLLETKPIDAQSLY